MTSNVEFQHETDSIKKSYDAIVQSIRKTYKGNISEKESHEAARNLIGFCRTLLAMKAEQEQNRLHEQ